MGCSRHLPFIRISRLNHHYLLACEFFLKLSQCFSEYIHVAMEVWIITQADDIVLHAQTLHLVVKRRKDRVLGHPLGVDDYLCGGAYFAARLYGLTEKFAEAVPVGALADECLFE